MTLYMKGGPDGKSVGDCPFAHYVRMTLEEKGLAYDLRPCIQATKPQWLIESYDGKMPALRSNKNQCRVESSYIAQYLDEAFADHPLKTEAAAMQAAETSIEGLFPAIARWLKHTPDGDDQDKELQLTVEVALSKLNDHLAASPGDFIAGPTVTLVDLSLTPKLYVLKMGNALFKKAAIDISGKFPALTSYMERMFSRPSFTKTAYPPDVFAWGWSSARS
jgi:glutathione S-transferase